jgi:RimJ/RimL family protein N-acetyltransferase
VISLATARLRLIPLTRRLMVERLAHNDFRITLGSPDGRGIHVGPQWPGDLLAMFPVWVDMLGGDDEAVADTYVVVERDTGEAVGAIGAKGGPDGSGAQEIGYGMNAAVRGRGYATEAVGALVTDLLKRVATVTAYTAVGNRPSQRVLEKLGFTRAGTSWTEEDGDLISWALRRPA